MAGLLLVGALVCVVALVVTLLVGDDSYEVTVPDSLGRDVDAAGAGSTLLALEQGLRERDVDAVTALAPSDDDEAQDLLSAVATNAAQLRVEDLSLRYVGEAGPVRADGSWEAFVDLTWAFAGFDQRPARTEVVVTLRPDGGRVAIESFGGEGRNPLWLTGPLSVVRSDTSLVLAAGSEADAERWATRVRRGIPVVLRVLPQWRPRVVLEVPDSGAGVDEALGAQPGTYAAIAGVTASADGTLGPDAPVHVYANPEVTARLRQRGAQVVISHELVHVATDAVSGVVPPWLLEGFADYVALRDVPLPLERTASRAAELARRDGLPTRLPGPEELDTRAEDLEAVYEQAWLVCRVLAQEAGEAALVATYRAVDAGTPVGAALRRHAGLTERELVELWRAEIEDLL